MTERSVYLLSVRAVLLALLGVFFLGGLGGASVSWLLVKKLLREAPGGTRVIERIEQVPGGGDGDFLSRVAEKAHGGVVGILDARGALLQSGVVLTADGLLVTPTNASLPRSPQVRSPDGTILPAAILREYPEKGLLLLRISGTFPAPRLETDTRLLPGTQGVVLRPVVGTTTGGARVVNVEYVGLPSSTRQRERPGVEQIGVLSTGLDLLYHGAPLYGSNGQLLGITILDREERAILLAPDVDLILQDVLRHPMGDSVSVLGSLRGTWVTGEEAQRRSLPSQIGFLVDAVSPESPSGEAGLRVQDVVVGIDGKPFPTAGSFWAILLEDARNAKPVTLDVRRGDENVTVVFTPRL